MNLTDEEKKMLDGKEGSIVQKAMEALVKIGEAFGAKKMIKAYSTHVYGFSTLSLMFSEDEIDELKRDVDAGLRVKCFTTTVLGGLDPNCSLAYGTPEWCDKALEGKPIYQKMGIALTNTCAPYIAGLIVPKHQPIAWCESSAWIFANSVFGATANRESTGAFFTALTGRLPEFGLHLMKNRLGTVLFDLNCDLKDHVDFGVLGYVVGKYVDRLWEVPVLNNVNGVTLEGLKNFSGAISSSGACAMFHMVGITPEAHSLSQAFGGTIPKEKIVITKKKLKETYEMLSNAKERDNSVDMVVLGCPHASIKEIIDIARLLEGKKIHENVILWVGTMPSVKVLADELSVTKVIQDAGGHVVNGCCQFVGMSGSDEDFPWTRSVKVVATDSPKVCHYAPAVANYRTWLGGVDKCINAAITGKWEG